MNERGLLFVDTLSGDKQDISLFLSFVYLVSRASNHSYNLLSKNLTLAEKVKSFVTSNADENEALESARLTWS